MGQETENNKSVNPTAPDGEKVEPAFEPEETFIRSIGLASNGAEPMFVDVKNGKIIRMRPLHYDDKYTEAELAPTRWKIEARGKVFESPKKALPGNLTLPYKKMVYSPNRVKYPLKRVDWDPKGERNPQNRGKSKYQRISWEEASEIISSEIERVRETYGPYAVLVMGIGGHHEAKNVHSQSASGEMLRTYKDGKYTPEVRNADSWEGWYWGTAHVWGIGSVGLAMPAGIGSVGLSGNESFFPGGSILQDVSDHTEMIVWEGADPETTPTGFGGYGWSRFCYWFTELGIKQVWIAPDLNYAAAVHADKWIPILPNTDMALSAAIIYTWIDEGTYDKDYVATHTVGFDKIEDYIMGREDGVPKTPAWASPRCGVPEWTIKALAREWASKVTSLGHCWGGPMIRGPYAHEATRFMAVQLGMQGMGKPGVHQIHNSSLTTPTSLAKIVFMGAGQVNSGQHSKQMVPRLLVHKAILDGSISSWGTTGDWTSVDDQFNFYEYPALKEKGGTEIHFIWSEKACNTSCWNDGYLFIEAIRSPKVECYITNNIWLQNDCQFSDLILPVSTQLEEADIMATNTGMMEGTQQSIVWIQKQAIDPVGESKSDYLIACEVAKKLGVHEDFTGGMTVEEQIRSSFDGPGMDKHISWEAFNEKQYWVGPTDPDWGKNPPGLRRFYEDPKANPQDTPSGKLEFYSQRLADNFPDDKERGPYPKYVVGGPGWSHDESLDTEYGAERCKTYPILFMSNHPRWRFHSSGEGNSLLREIPTCKVKGYDGYSYEPLWMHPNTAAQRGIKNGDIVKVFNERGIVLFGAYVTERIIPGVVSADHGAHVDLITDRIDRGGSTDLISPTGIMSKNAGGIVVSGYLVEVEKLDQAEMEEWRQKYPEAFARDYDPAYGLTSSAWVEGSK